MLYLVSNSSNLVNKSKPLFNVDILIDLRIGMVESNFPIHKSDFFIIYHSFFIHSALFLYNSVILYKRYLSNSADCAVSVQAVLVSLEMVLETLLEEAKKILNCQLALFVCETKIDFTRYPQSQ